MSLIKFSRGTTTWTASCFRTYPVDDPLKVNVVVDYSDGGQLYAYEKGVDEQLYILTFDKLIADDDQVLRDFHANEAVGPKNTFTYTDETGADHTVRWLDVQYPIKKTKNNHYSGTIRLRKEV